MGRVNKHRMIKNMTGMNAPVSKGAALAAGPDNVPAMIHDQEGNPQQPAMIKEGEIVFSVESIVGLGKGNYDDGAAKLLALHDKLRNMGLELLQQNSLAGAPGPTG